MFDKVAEVMKGIANFQLAIVNWKLKIYLTNFFTYTAI